jgi:hypothetical protein
LTGWDYSTTGGTDKTNKYVLDEKLAADSYIAITLAWDRLVELVKDPKNKTAGVFEFDDTFADKGLTNLNLYLLPKGAANFNNPEAQSISLNYSVEHIFFQIKNEGEYEIWVHQADAPHGAQQYALAWQAVAAVPEPASVVMLGLGAALLWSYRRRQQAVVGGDQSAA